MFPMVASVVEQQQQLRMKNEACFVSSKSNNKHDTMLAGGAAMCFSSLSSFSPGELTSAATAA